MSLTVLRIFVSSTWLDLQPERQALERAIQRIRETKFAGMEYFGSREETTLQVSLAELQKADVYVGVLGARYGSGITEAEYRKALDSKLPCFIYVKDKSAIAPEWQDTDPERQRCLTAMEETVRRTHTISVFKTPDELAALFTADWHRWFFDQYLPTEMDGELPLNLKSGLSTEGWLRFAAHNPSVPFRGRGPELAALRSFLDDPRLFLWWIVTGPGGAGKTRIALELCLRADGWRAGFLRHFSAKETWSLSPSWRPHRPTLIVVDYALEQIELVGALASQLATQLQDSDPPVRLLLLERNVDNVLEKRFVGTTASEAGAVQARRYPRGPLVLPKLGEDEIWALVCDCPWLPKGARLSMSREQFFTRLIELDDKRRPLVAMILAEASALSPERTVFGTLEQELEALIERDRHHLWPDSLGVTPTTRIGGCDADVIIGFATMVNGVGNPELAENASHFSRLLDLDFLADCARATGHPWNEAEARVGPLEPDLIGEFFVLTVVGRGSATAAPNAWLAEAAWRTNENAMATFVARAAQNFPQHPALNRVDIIVPGLTESWWNAIHGALPLFRGSPEKTQAALDAARTDEGAAGAVARLTLLGQLVEVLKPEEAIGSAVLMADLLRLYPGNLELERAAGNSILITINHAKSIGNLSGRDAALNALRRFADHYPDSVTARYWLASGLLIVLQQAKQEGDLARRNALLNEMRAIAAQHPAEMALCGQLAMGLATTLVHAKEEDDLVRRDELMEELRELSARLPANEAVRRELATSLFNCLVFANEEEMFQRRDALLDELHKLATHYPNDGAVRSRFAMALTNTSVYVGTSVDLMQSDALLGELRALHQLYPDDSKVRQRLAESIYNRINGANENLDIVKSDALLEELRALQKLNPDDGSIRVPFATALTNSSVYAKRRDDLNRRDTLLGELRQLAGDHPDDKAVRQQLATGLFNTLNQANTEGALTRRDMLLEELRQLAGCNPDDPSVRERLADGLLHTLIHAQDANDLIRREGLLNELRQLAADHADDGPIRGLFAMGLHNWLYFEVEQRRAICDAPLEELRSLVKQYPDDEIVRRQLAKGLLKTFAIANTETNTGISTSLLEELWTLARKHLDDIVVQQMLAVALTQYLTGKDTSHQFDATALGELQGLAERNPDDGVLREALATGLFGALVSTDEANQFAQRDALLQQLNQLIERYPIDAAVRKPFVGALINLSVRSRKRGDSPQPDQFLERLRQLAQQHRDDLLTQQGLSGALSQSLADVDDRLIRDGFLTELNELAERYPNDQQLLRSLATGFFATLVGAIKHEGLDLEQRDALLGKLSRLAEGHPEDPELSGVYAMALADLSLLAHAHGALVQRDELLLKLRQLSERHSGNPTVSHWLAYASESLASNSGADADGGGIDTGPRPDHSP